MTSITSTTRYSRLTICAVLAVGLVACGQPGSGAFCEQAEFFASRSTRDIDHHHTGGQSAAAYLDALVRLRDLAPANLRADLDVLVAYEQSYDPSHGDQPHGDGVNGAEATSAGQRAGSAIELRCDLQLPNV